jgi:NAD(P)-dependent dehydrogenase (short-subunit alcohol dehydrogenase family)
MTPKQKTVAVAGASQGIGPAVANLLLERSYNVVAHSRNISRTADLQRSDSVALLGGDMALATTAERLLSTGIKLFGSLASSGGAHSRSEDVSSQQSAHFSFMEMRFERFGSNPYGRAETQSVSAVPEDCIH